MNLFNPVRRTRQHHAIEHATITLLMRRNPGIQSVAGRSDHRGFYVFGRVETAALEAAVQEALRRLQGGEAGLAIHPNCGTNLVTAGVLTGLAAFTTTTMGRQQRLSWPDLAASAILAATAALWVSRPLGTLLQARVTTLADVRRLRVVDISRRQMGRWVWHFVAIQPTPPAPRGPAVEFPGG